MKPKRSLRAVLCGLLLLTVGVTCGWYFKARYDPYKATSPSLVRENSADYHFINPLLLVAGLNESSQYNDLKKSIDAYITGTFQKNKDTSAAVYFQDLNSGNWTGVNTDTSYGPSSMLKVAVMLGYLKDAAKNQKVLTQELKYTHKENKGQHYPPEHALADGYYSARELIEAMIVNSDNDALESLYNNNRQAYINVFKELDIQPPPDVNTIDFMSPKIYSRIFRILYSSTYLPRTTSEQALQLLSYTNFKNGLVAGVPENTVVSHKFGEHTVIDQKGNAISRELHDCGIIYYPKKPYFLCVMTKGSDFSKLETIISDISKITYNYLNSNK